ncbi:preprotein translocase subunit SecE [Rubrobacter indicoceani]|uniref:preprotein translocase subunit SecE n=1 Tax=Rubrobacter indicoceani TaxID=2051957 RepID=UPI0013C51D09|nr:preprotein translocase subunit SecE [Rubrobacter indicoceani]
MAKKQSAQAEASKSGAKPQKKGGPVKFVKDVRNELRKVSWPDRSQLRQSTAIVIIVVIALMLYVAAWDFVFRNVANFIFG